jgi:hypothetical protein
MCGRKVKVAVMASFAAKRNMNVNTCHFKFLIEMYDL